MYRWNPADYNQNSSMQAKFAHDLLARQNLTGSERVLDLGCGDGKVTAGIARRLPRGSVLGIDVSPEMIDFARQNFPRDEYPNLDFDIADGSHLAFDDEFDWVVSFAALHWIHEYQPVLAGVARALRPRGRLVLEFGGTGNGGPLFDLTQQIVNTSRWRTYFRDFTFPWKFYGAAEYECLVSHAGLVPERVELVPREAAHAGRAGFAGWMRTTWIPYLQNLPRDLWDAFISDVVERYLAVRAPDADGMVRVPMIRLEVEAHKP